jgi:hypothetical protein
MFFRFTGFGNANGEHCKLLVNIAVKDMPEDGFFVFEVKGLAHTSEVSSSGYLVMTKRRVLFILMVTIDISFRTQSSVLQRRVC